jgi:Protein of unknown function (DUF1559)
MSSNDMDKPADGSKKATKSHRQFSLRVLLLLPVAIVLPFAVGHLTVSPLAVMLVLLVELVAGFTYRPTRILTGVALLVLILMVAALLWDASSGRQYARASQCRNNLRQIVLALHDYHDVHNCFPPAYLADENGRPMHSWRVLILPFLDEKELYEQYRFDEPWDGPNNSRLTGGIPYLLRCPSEPWTTNTNYFLIAGDGTAWADGRTPRIDDFTDGLAETIIVVEVANSNVLWTEPHDLAMDEAMRGINWAPGMGISSRHPLGGRREKPESANVAFGEGQPVNLKNDFPLDEFERLLTHQGGEAVVRPE